MKRKVIGALALVLGVAPPLLLAKGQTVRISIKGPGVTTPIEITDPETLAGFHVWSGPGTSSTALGTSPKTKDGFIVDWSQGPISERPRGLQRYEVFFYAKHSEKFPGARLVYVVSYEFDPLTEQGYIYLPQIGDEWYKLNVRTIYRKLEGRWFRASNSWENVARPLIGRATVPKR